MSNLADTSNGGGSGMMTRARHPKTGSNANGDGRETRRADRGGNYREGQADSWKYKQG